MKKKIPDNEITVYQTADGKINIQVFYANENIWLQQKRIAELFDVDRSVVTKHLKNIFTQKELQEESVCANYAHTAEDGKTYQTKFYSLEAIIAVGYRVNSERGTQFRQWAISILQQYIHKGFEQLGFTPIPVFLRAYRASCFLFSNLIFRHLD